MAIGWPLFNFWLKLWSAGNLPVLFLPTVSWYPQSSHLRTFVRIWRTKISKDTRFFMPVRLRDTWKLVPSINCMMIWVHKLLTMTFHFNKKWHQFNWFKIKPSWHKALLVHFTWKPLWMNMYGSQYTNDYANGLVVHVCPMKRPE